MNDFITSIEKYRRGWGGGQPETPCGAGSRLSATVGQRAWIPKIIRKYRIKTVSDIGAGDLNWIKETKFPKSVEYTPYDLVPRETSVIKFNLLEEIPPKSDLLMCLWVLNHFPYDNCLKAIENLKASGSKYLLMTDRPKWYKEQPPEIRMESIESIVVHEARGDSIKLIKL